MNKETNHAERSHALLSASGSSRWMNCTPSARLEERFPEEKSSVFADEGTLAHEIAEVKLTGRASDLDRLKEHELYQDEMEDHTDTYVNYCEEQYQAAKKVSEYAEMRIEEKIDLTEYIPEGFGSNDCIVVRPGLLEVIDLKYGKGIKINAKDNSQLKLYALGALLEMQLLFEIDTVKMTIVQPRLGHISSFEMSTSDLLAWGDEFVKPTAQKAFDGEGETKAGDWCRWCRAKAKCRTLADYHLDIARHEFSDPQLLDDDELLEVYAKLDTLSNWADSVKSHILTEALQGKKWKGLKVVEGRSIRKISDTDKAVELLEGADYKQADFMDLKLKALGKLEKLVGKKEFTELMKPVLIKPAGKPTLAHADDKRPEFNTAQADFEVID